MSRKSGRLATSLLNQRMLLYYFISLIFYTVSLTKAANISKQKYYHDAYQIFFGITPSLLFRRVSRLSYAGSPPAGLETVAEVFQEVAAVKERVIAPSASLIYCTRTYQFDRWFFHRWWLMVWTNALHLFPTPKRMNDIFASHNGCARSQSPRWFVVQTLPTAAQIAWHTLQRHGILPEGHIMLWNVWSAIFQFDPTSLMNLSRTSRACGTCSNSKATWRWWLPWWQVASLL